MSRLPTRTRSSPPRIRRDSSVFLNVPFDDDYEPCFLALIAGLVGTGFSPRSVLQVPPSRDRLRRIYGLIQSCRYSLHDLSRVELSEGLYPRFNMPFEAGLASAIAFGRERHERFLLETVRHRLLRTCSDLNGTDAEIHGGTPEGVLRSVLNLFRRPTPPPAGDLKEIWSTLMATAAALKAGGDTSGIYTAANFDNLVLMARAVDAEQRAARTRKGRKS